MANKNPSYKFYNFDILWKYFPLGRSFKEDLKFVLFSLFPFFFKNWMIYLNWRNARVYKNHSLHPLKLGFWKRKLRQSYPIPILKDVLQVPIAQSNHELAVVVHVFYPNIFDEIIQLLSQVHKTKISLYVTGPEPILEKYHLLVAGKFSSVKFFPSQNRGRDILPFLKVLPVVFEDGHKLVLKLHTKGSNHLNRKVHWRDDLFSKLIGVGQIDWAVNILSENSHVGMIGPSLNILPMHNYYGSNAEIVNALSRQMGVLDNQLHDLNFVAGSMFFVKKEALLPILKLGLSDQNFEEENGQKDGTLAHAIERLYAVGLIKAGLQLADSDFNPEKSVLMVNKNHYFSS